MDTTSKETESNQNIWYEIKIPQISADKMDSSSVLGLLYDTQNKRTSIDDTQYIIMSAYQLCI